MTIGIYCIKNKINGKVYVGKSSNIEHRFWTHKNKLTKSERDKKQTNRHLWAAVQKYGFENFEMLILESFEILDEGVLKDAEIKWMDHFNSCDRSGGYNLRRDSSTETTVSAETRQLISENNQGDKNPNFGKRWTDKARKNMSDQKKAHALANPMPQERRIETSKMFKALWQDKEKLAKMAKTVAKLNSKYRFYEYDKVTGELLRVWEGMYEILEEHPHYHTKAIYGVCDKHKKSYKGSVWVKELKEK